MEEKIEVKVLADNEVYESGLLAEHGLSFWIKYGDKKFLFDTGQGLVLEHNAVKMGIDLDSLSGVMLSHGHFDHGGGVGALIDSGEKIPLYAHPRVFAQKYARDREEDRLEKKGIEFSRDDVRFNSVISPEKIVGELSLTGEISRSNEWEKTPERYLVRSAGEKELEKDDFRDDQALFFPTDSGLVILLGCAHSGVVNTVEYIKSISSFHTLRAVMGGMHLHDAEKNDVERTIRYLAEQELELIVPMHCTGFYAQARMKQALKSSVEIGEVGMSFKF